MGSKKHKKHKSERRERHEDRQFCLERPPSLKLILKVGGNSSTPEHGNDSPAYGIQPESMGLFTADYYPPEKHKKSKKKKKKKDREKRHKHHKEKRRPKDDSSQEDFSLGDDSSQLNETLMQYANISTAHSLASVPVTKPLIPMKSPEPELPIDHFIHDQVMASDTHSPSVMSNKSSDAMKSPSSMSDASGREPRSCVLKLKQSKSPLSKLLDHLLRALEKKDPHQFFAWPVTDDIAPGYSSIIDDPMDFLTIRQKVEESQYGTLQEFIDDFTLMCENAIKYNHVETVYHKAAKRLLHVGGKMLQPDNLIRSLRPLMVYLRELSPKELGFDLSAHRENPETTDSHIIDSADEGMSTGAEELNSAQLEEEEKRKNIRLENNPKTRFEAYVDDMTADEVMAQVQNAAKLVQNRIQKRRNPNKMGFLRYNKDGTTSMQIMFDLENECPERVVSIGEFTGKLQQGTGQLQGLREDRRNNAKTVEPLSYGSFCSFAPIYDSRFSNLSKEESVLVLNTYEDQTGMEYSGSIMEFTKESSYASSLAHSLLDLLTCGEHRKTIATLYENQQQRSEQKEIEESFPNPIEADDPKKFDNIKIDFDNLRSLSDLGIDTQFLTGLEHDIQIYECQKKIQEQLTTTSSLIEQLHKVQTERLSQPLPAHLSHIQHPNSDEIQLAAQITSNLTEISKQFPPESITTPHALRKAMGLTDIGLEPIANQQQQLNRILIEHQIQKNEILDIDRTSVPMDLETDTVRQTSTAQVDLENELREFLEGGTALTSSDDVGIEQMLLD